MSVSNTSSIPTLAGGMIDLAQVIKEQKDPSLRRTKIICTIGPACWSVENLSKLIAAGMNVARFNFSHGDHVGHGAVLERLRTAAKNMKRDVAVLLDTKGPEIRTGFFKEGTDKIHLVKGEQIILTSDYSYKGDETKLACSYEKLAESVKPGQEILVADGSLVLTVLSCDETQGECLCRIENNASIGERKNMNRKLLCFKTLGRFCGSLLEFSPHACFCRFLKFLESSSICPLLLKRTWMTLSTLESRTMWTLLLPVSSERRPMSRICDSCWRIMVANTLRLSARLRIKRDWRITMKFCRLQMLSWLLVEISVW